jgi:hypothetical protein
VDFGCAQHLVPLDIADHRGAGSEGTVHIGGNETIVGKAVETVTPAFSIEPEKMLAEPRQIRGP